MLTVSARLPEPLAVKTCPAVPVAVHVGVPKRRVERVATVAPTTFDGRRC